MADLGRNTPIVGVICDRRLDDGVSYDTARGRYAEALLLTARALPLLLPLEIGAADLSCTLSRLDGLVLTGAESNLQPSLYGETPTSSGGLDPARDRLAVAAIHAAVELGLPLLGICRGLQEINVAFSGSLHQDLGARPNGLVHWEDISLRRDEQYRPVHPVKVTQGTLLHRLVRATSIEVNSLHRQGIASLGVGLRVEASAPDGLVEAVSIPQHGGFALGVQWHIDWFHGDPTCSAIWVGFGDACGRYASRRLRGSGAFDRAPARADLSI